MKPETFIAWAEGYYGVKYNPVCRAELLTWLKGKESYFIAGLRVRVREEYSNQYRIPPDIAILDKFRQQETYDRGREEMAIAAQKAAALSEKKRGRLAYTPQKTAESPAPDGPQADVEADDMVKEF